MSDTDNAVEYFAGPLPPGARMSEHPEGGFWVDHRCRNGGAGGPMSTWPRGRAAEIGWHDWSAMSHITRRAYAESQCVARVREVAAAKYRAGPWEIEVAVFFEVAGTVYIRIEGQHGNLLDSWRGPDLLLAAWAACRAMEVRDD